MLCRHDDDEKIRENRYAPIIYYIITQYIIL